MIIPKCLVGLLALSQIVSGSQDYHVSDEIFPLSMDIYGIPSDTTKLGKGKFSKRDPYNLDMDNFYKGAKGNLHGGRHQGVLKFRDRFRKNSFNDSDEDDSSDDEPGSPRFNKYGRPRTVSFEIPETTKLSPPGTPNDVDDILKPDPKGFRKITFTQKEPRGLKIGTGLSTSFAEFDLSPSTVNSIAPTPTSSPDTTPISTPSSSPESPSHVPQRKGRLLNFKPKSALRITTTGLKKHKKVLFPDGEDEVFTVSPAPLVDGEDSNFWSKSEEEMRKREKPWEQDEDYEEGDGGGIFGSSDKQRIDWDAFLNVDELLEEYLRSKQTR